MLAASAATAELRGRNRQALGVSTLQRGLDLDVLIDAYQSSTRRVTQSEFQLDVPQDYVEAAWLGDWEASYDITVRQTLTYVDAVGNGRNAAWTAVTGYYAAFFAARSFLYAVGIGHRGLARRGIMGGGLYELSVIPGSGIGVVTLRCRKQGAGGSHKNAWLEVERLLQALQFVGGLDLASVNVISSMASLISQPDGINAFRNRVNYSLEIAGQPVTQWTSEMTRLLDPPALESALAGGRPIRDEHRSELLLLGLLSWIQELYADYLDRAQRPDRRRMRARAQTVESERPAIAEVLRRWL